MSVICFAPTALIRTRGVYRMNKIIDACPNCLSLSMFGNLCKYNKLSEDIRMAENGLRRRRGRNNADNENENAVAGGGCRSSTTRCVCDETMLLFADGGTCYYLCYVFFAFIVWI